MLSKKQQHIKVKKKMKRTNFKKILNFAVNLIYPCRCPYCNDVIFQGGQACKKCEKILERKAVISQLENGICISAFEYNGIYRQAIHKMKFGGNCNYAEQIAISIYKAIEENCNCTVDIVTYIPFTKNEYVKRGYNQSQLIAKYISMQYGNKCVPLLIKSKDNKPQKELSKQERIANVKNIFVFNKKYDIKDKNILLIDDVCTTGATLNECSRVLLDSGCNSVVCGTYAKTPLY